MSAPPRLFDRELHRRRLTRAARGYGGADFLKRRLADDLVDRLSAVNRLFPVALDLGARGGAFGRALTAHVVAGDVAKKIDWLIACDLSEAMLAGQSGMRLVADEERLPLAPGSVDLVVSAMGLHWVNDLVGVLIQIRQALRPDGLFLAAMPGGATLTELRQCLLEAELSERGGAGPRVSPFIDAHDAGGLLQRAGFALPVVDVDRITVRYDHALHLMADLRAMGETSVLVDHPAAPLTRSILDRACAIYAERFAQPDGRIVATFEIVTLTGWAPHPDQQQPLARGSAKMRLADALSAVTPS